MAVAKPHELPALLSRRREPPAVLLVHGADRSAVFDICKSAVAALTGGANEMSVVRLADGERDRLYTEVFALSMFGGRQAVWFSVAGDASTQAIERILAAEERGNPIVVESAFLPKSSKLRKLCEASAKALVVAVYEESIHELRDRLAALIHDVGLSIEPDAMALLLDLVASERGVATSETEKLAAYAFGSQAITAEDVRAICGDAHEATLDELVDAVFLGDLSAAERSASALDAAGTRNILGAAQSHAAKLGQLALQSAQGQPPEAVVRQPANAIFFKRQSAIARQLKVWTPERLIEAEAKIAAGILQSRRSRGLDSAIVNRTLLAVGWMALSPAP